jgi:hypothetical protein
MTMYIGADPEFVVTKVATGEPVPAHLFFPDKHNKIAVPLKPCKYSTSSPAKLFRDGFNLEVNLPPSTCRAYFATWMQEALKAAFAKIGPEYTLAPVQAVQIDLNHMKDAPDDLKTFGCEPSYCAYRLVAKVPDIDAMSHPWRYAGGHMHFSDTDPKSVLSNPDNHPDMIRVLDFYLGLPLACLFGDDLSTQRRKYYGQAGEFRTQMYGKNDIGLAEIGLEYRTPGPEVWTDENVIAGFAFGIGKRLLSNQGFVGALKTLDKAKDDDVREAIDSAPEKAWNLVAAVEGFYDPDFLKLLKLKLSRKLNLHLADRDLHPGFREVVIGDWGLKIPGVPLKLRRAAGIIRSANQTHDNHSGYEYLDSSDPDETPRWERHSATK